MAGNAVGFDNFLRFPVQAMKTRRLYHSLTCMFSRYGYSLLFIEWSSGGMEKFASALHTFSIQSQGENYCLLKIWTWLGRHVV
jgi:SNF family Na+-dependent transporter